MTASATLGRENWRGREFRMTINGELVAAASGEWDDSIDPFTGTPWAKIPVANDSDVDRAVGAAHSAFTGGAWAGMPGKTRAKLMRNLAERIDAHAQELSYIESIDNGKLLREMSGQMAGLPEWYYFFAGMADKLNGETIGDDRAYLKYTQRQPVGVVASITPWNSPLLLLAFKLAPALAAGCTVVAKPAEQASASTLAFAALFEEAGFPPGVFNVIAGPGAVGARLVADRRVSKVAFTGSTATGIRVAHGAADHLASVSLELGGKSPHIVFADAVRADRAAVVNGVLAGIFAATGQTCVAGARLFVEESVHDELVDALAARATTIRLGDPLVSDTEMGPIAFEAHMEKVLGYIDAGVDAGAEVAAGGKRPDSPELANGYFVEPTVLSRVNNTMAVAREEIFGPVLSVIPFTDESTMLAEANDSEYGLAAGVWTNDIRRAHRVAAKLDVGTVWVNSYRALAYDTPFAGRKMSGLGVENGLDTMREYTQLKSVWVELTGKTRDPFSLG